MTKPPVVHPAIPAFTAGFRPRKMGKEAIRSWIIERKKVRRPNSIRKWLNGEIEKAETALIDLKPIKTHPDVELARRNARVHLEWAKAAKAQLLRMYPDARSQYRSKRRPRRPSRLRVGTLAREAQVFDAHRPGKPS